jgi:RNA polymerase sigma factor (sigma-70 family)
MMTTKLMSATVNKDAELVSGTLAGNRDAFGHIVSRYQSLICSLAYSATGSLGQSEDLAQETFITAWKHIGRLRERDKLRSWLCGIARNRINNFLRREGREPNHQAESIEEIAESHSPEPLPVDHTISNEEQAILWRSLERIPEIYREPLVLFYREHQSIEAVAEKLELTEDNVKQRLSRGRKLLHEQVLAFVEGALERTNPGRAFTIGVLAALPTVMMTSAKAATIAVAAAKGGVTVKTAGAMGMAGVLGMLATPLLIIFGNFIPYRMGLAEARSDQERRYIKSYFHTIYAASLGLATLLAAALYFIGWAKYGTRPDVIQLFQVWFLALIVFYLLAIFISSLARRRKYRAHLTKILALEPGGVFPPAAYEFCSKTKLFGLPLLHVRIGDRFDILKKPVTAWIAVGNCAIGGLFAFGAVSFAPFCIGGLTIGLLPFGGVALGIVPVGGIALGALSFGGVVIGWQAIGGFALAWKAAVGSLAIAHDFAVGGIARAAQANTELAKQFIGTNLYFGIIQAVNRHWVWMNLLWIAPLFIQWQIIARSRRREPKNS